MRWETPWARRATMVYKDIVGGEFGRNQVAEFDVLFVFLERLSNAMAEQFPWAELGRFWR